MKKKLNFSEDYVWMSMRYCIGRKTIASQMHAVQIAKDVYDAISDDMMRFYSEDICMHIYEQLNYFIHFNSLHNIPKDKFKPIDVIYSIFNKEGIDSDEKLKSINAIEIEWNRDKNDFDYSIHYLYNEDNGISFSGFRDLEIWQKLANLFDKSVHHHCEAIDGSICEYYECYISDYTIDKKYTFKKYKCPVDCLDIQILMYIPETRIKKDNLYH